MSSYLIILQQDRSAISVLFKTFFASFESFIRPPFGQKARGPNIGKANCSGDKSELANLTEEKEMPPEGTSDALDSLVFVLSQVILETSIFVIS